jgi:uncharacterized damage-inducible protein DinB
MPLDAKRRALDAMNASRKIMTDVMAPISDAQATHLGSPSENHLAWTLGHMSSTAAWFHTAIGGKPEPLPESYSKLFGMGSAPVADASKYPPIAELRKQYASTYAAFLQACEAMSEAELTQPPAIDTGGFMKDRLNAIEVFGWHEGWHAGQLSVNRRSMGLKPMWG